jgi:hypothetical protein
MRRIAQGTVVVCVVVCGAAVGAQRTAAPDQGTAPAAVEYRVLATNKTSTMEKELNDAADVGFRFQSVMGGETTFGGK